MDNATPKPYSRWQNVLAGIACAFYVIYKFELSDPKVIKDLGISYPWVIMIWVIIMIFSAGFSGVSLFLYVTKYAPIVMKTIALVKKGLKEDEQ